MKEIQIEYTKAIWTIHISISFDLESIYRINLRFPVEVSHLTELRTLLKLEVLEEIMIPI
jgi:hypothetical protein